jgi:CheY-like chemotaxis protein
MARVMLVEDNDDVRYLAAFVLAAAGHEVIEPASWASLLEPEPWTNIDVAVVDLFLADVVNGAHILAYLAEHHPHIRRIVFTSSLDESAGEPAYEEALALSDVFVSKFDAAGGLIEAVNG